MLTYEDVPRRLNLASWFVDRNLEEGRGGRTALIGPDGATTYAELAALVNRTGTSSASSASGRRSESSSSSRTASSSSRSGTERRRSAP